MTNSVRKKTNVSYVQKWDEVPCKIEEEYEDNENERQNERRYTQKTEQKTTKQIVKLKLNIGSELTKLIDTKNKLKKNIPFKTIKSHTHIIVVIVLINKQNAHKQKKTPNIKPKNCKWSAK